MRLVCHGDGPVDKAMQMGNGTPFTWAGAHYGLQLEDRVIGLQAMRCYFPSSPNATDRITAIEWVHASKGSPRGPSPIIARRVDGSELKHVFPSSDDGFVWSPVVTRDGEWIFFAKGPPMASAEEDVDIWKVRSDGTDATNLTAGSNANDAFPDVSADGQWVVFRSGRDGSKQIYLMDKDGQQLQRISVLSNDTSTMPAISPDGKQVVYSTSRFGGFKLCVQSLEDPQDEGRLLEPDRASLMGSDMHPRYSPDGKWIVFVSDRAGFMDEWPLSGRAPQPYGEVFAIPSSGRSKAVRLTNDKWEDGLPYWCLPPTNKIRNQIEK
jgi:Tol biopolymer transport system component